MDILMKCREKVYEHSKNCFMIILKALWGSEKIADEQVFKIIQIFLHKRTHTVNVSELIPPKIPFKDLSFALSLARGELDLSRRAAKRVMEKIEILRLAGEWLQSPVLQLLYKNILKRLEQKEKLDEKTLETLIELQGLVEKEESKNK